MCEPRVIDLISVTPCHPLLWKFHPGSSLCAVLTCRMASSFPGDGLVVLCFPSSLVISWAFPLVVSYTFSCRAVAFSFPLLEVDLVALGFFFVLFVFCLLVALVFVLFKTVVTFVLLMLGLKFSCHCRSCLAVFATWPHATKA